MNRNTAFRVWAGIAAALAAGCASMTPPTTVHQPMSMRPPPQPAQAAPNGAIFQARTAYRPLFEDLRARNVGDTLVININEKTAASKKSNSAANKNGSLAFAIPTVTGLPGKGLQGATVNGNSDNKFDSKGESATNNDFTGIITVTVIEIYSNGNLLVSGEKQIGINQGSEFIRFSGVVNPATIASGNVVSSTQVADARIEYRGAGYIDEAQTMGWAQRVFMTLLPF